MADKTVLDLDAAGAFNGTETIEVVQSGSSKKQGVGRGVKQQVVDTIAELRLIEPDNDVNVIVRGYYAKGDGGGGPIRIPLTGSSPGTYVDNGGSVIVPTGGDGSSAWGFIATPFVDVKWFGATGDGSTDDTDALQNVLNEYALKSVVRFSPGIYIVNQPLYISRSGNKYTDYTLKGLYYIGYSASIRKGPSFSGNALLNIESAVDDEDEIYFKGIQFDGNDRLVIGLDFYNRGTAISFDATTNAMANTTYAKYVKFENCVFTRCYVGARATGNSISFINCMFRFNELSAFVTNAGNNIQFSGCSFRRNAMGARMTTLDNAFGTVNVAFHSCIFESNDWGAFEIQGASVEFVACYFEANGPGTGGRPYNTADAILDHATFGHVGIGAGGFAPIFIMIGCYIQQDNKELNCNYLGACAIVHNQGAFNISPRSYGALDQFQCNMSNFMLNGPVNQLIDIDSSDDIVNDQVFYVNTVAQITDTSGAPFYHKKTALDETPSGSFDGSEVVTMVQGGSEVRQSVGTAIASNITTSQDDVTPGALIKRGDIIYVSEIPELGSAAVLDATEATSDLYINDKVLRTTELPTEPDYTVITTFSSSWASSGTNINRYKIHSGTMHLHLLLNASAATDTLVVTLPTGHRPVFAAVPFAVSDDNGPSEMRGVILTNGEVRIYGYTATNVAVSASISFPLA